MTSQRAAGEGTGYGMEYQQESVDRDDVNGKLKDAADAAWMLSLIAGTGEISNAPDKRIGRIAQNALENGYKAVLGAHGCEYPATGRNGHNLTMLKRLIRENLGISGSSPCRAEAAAA